MFTRHSWQAVAAVVLLALVVAGCETTTGRTAGQYTDDATITSAVKAKLVADHASNFTRVGVSTNNGVVYLTGTADSADRAARAAQLASAVPGVRNVVNEIQVAAAPAATSTTVVTAPPSSSATTVTTSPAPATTIATGQGPVDVSGVVARFDPQTGIVTFRDGRMVKLTSTTAIWGPASASAVQPGAQIFVRNGEALRYQPSVAIQPGVTSWRIGTVNHVDQASGLIFLNDGSIVRVAPSTMIQAGNQRVGLTQIQPGAQIAIGLPAAGATAAASVPATPTVTAPSGAAPSALPREAVVPLESPQIEVFVVPQPVR